MKDMKYMVKEWTDWDLNEYSFEELKKLFEPEREDLPDEWQIWEMVTSLEELKEFLKNELEIEYGRYEFEEIPSDLDIVAEAISRSSGKVPESCYGKAQKELENGTMVYDLQECREYITGTLFQDEDERKGDFWQSYVDMLEKNIPARDWDVVTKWGKPYFVEYCC